MPESIELIIAAISAMAGLGLAAFAMVDALKALPGGASLSNVGFKHIREGVLPFAAPMSVAAGKATTTSEAATGSWEELLRAQWRNGREKEAQKGLVRSLVRLGLTDGQAGEIATYCNVDQTALQALIVRLKAGETPSEQESNLLSRVDAMIGYRIDAAFERADHHYRNAMRTWAGAIAIVLAIAGAFLLNAGCPAPNDQAAAACAASVFTNPFQHWGANILYGLAAGILAVPIAPIAKDLISSLSAAVTAVKAVRGR